MEYGAIDLHLRRSVFRIEDTTGALVAEGRIDTTRSDLTRIFGARTPMPVLLESSTESEWVAVLLESFGHEVIVADPSYLPMYGARQRRVKTDQRDCTGAGDGVSSRPLSARPPGWQPPRGPCARSCGYAGTWCRCGRKRSNTVGALLRQEGLRLPSGAASSVEARLARVTLPVPLARVLAPLQSWLTQLQTLIAQADAGVKAHAAADPAAQYLMSVPGVGPVIALTYRAVLDSPARFAGDPGRAERLYRPGAVGIQLRRSAAARAHYQTWSPRATRVTGPGELGRVARTRCRKRAAPPVGPSAGRPPRPSHCDRRAGAPLESHHARRLAGCDGLCDNRAPART